MVCSSKRTVLFCCVLVVSLANITGFDLVTKGGRNDHRYYRHKERLLPLDCGIQNPVDKIYGGAICDIDEHPWMALLSFDTGNGTHFACGGTLISKRYVLTNGHCAYEGGWPSHWNLTHVRLGEWNTSAWLACPEGDGQCGPPHQDIIIEEIIVHEQYKNEKDQPNNIALLRLDRDAEFNDFVKPICLPLSNELKQSVFIGEQLDVVGWGQTETSAASDVKRKVPVPVISNAICAKKYKTINYTIDNTQICAGGVGGRDSCTGDSGGPLIARRGDIFMVVGIVSHGTKPCGQEGWPGIYTRVGACIDWILSKLRP